MAQMDSILVKDDSATPTEFCLVPIADAPNCSWRSSVANVPLEGQVRLTLSSDPTKNGGSKMSVKLEVPVLETLGASGTSAGYVAPPKVAYVSTCIFTMFSDRRSTTQNRADALKMAIGILQGASATTGTGTLANTAAGHAFNDSPLPITQALVCVIKPN